MNDNVANNVASSDSQANLLAERRASRRAAWFWGTLVVSFLTMQVGIGAAAIVLATNDPSVAVVPDYYQKALDWDKSMEAQRVSDLLGWTATVQVGEPIDASGQRFVSVRMIDAEGKGLDQLQGQMKIYHHARATDRQSFPLELLGSGVYRGQCLMTRDGLWEVELQFSGQAETERFIDSQTLSLELADASPASDGATR